MTAISVDRYLALRYHMRYPNMMTSRRATCVAATFWCKNVIFSLLSIWKKNTILLVAVVFVALCLLTSSITYIAIYRIVRHHQHQIHAQQQAVQSINAEKNLKIQVKKRAANTFMYYICMVLCYFPGAVSILISMTYKDHRNIRWRHFADTILFMNSAINPFLYFWRYWEVQKAVLKIVRKRLCKTDKENLDKGHQWNWWFICDFILRSIKDSLETLRSRYCCQKIRDQGRWRNYVTCYVKQMEKT